MFSSGLASMMGGQAAQAQQPQRTETKEILNLNQLIEENKSECQNADPSTPFVNLLQCSDSYTLKSDCDEQLLFNIYFQMPVKIHHLVIRAPALESAPLNMKMYINRAPMSFSDMESIDPVEELEIQEGELQGDIILNYVKYQNVSNLTIFVENNRDGGDVTEMSKLEIHGSPLLDCDMSKLKKVG
jgi:hypothetical protein